MDKQQSGDHPSLLHRTSLLHQSAAANHLCSSFFVAYLPSYMLYTQSAAPSQLVRFILAACHLPLSVSCTFLFSLAIHLAHLHKDFGMSITPKVHFHLMWKWKHVKHQMEFPGGLGEKREDWVENQHQITRQLRILTQSPVCINSKTIQKY
jgi:hypothetical protein